MALVALLIGCGSGTSPPPERPPGGFDDHTVPRIESQTAFFELAAQGVGRQVSKYVITSVRDEDDRAIRFMDGNFYQLHDEWFWFRLINGAPIPGIDDEPAQGLSFDSIEAVYDWARQQSQLPLDLTWAGDSRLYSPRFYVLGLGRPREFGLGTLMHVAARESRSELWLFELEFTDNPSHAELVVYFDTVLSAVSDDIAAELKWVVRSPVHEDLAQRMEADGLQYHDRIVRYSELAVPGEIEVYSEGLTAGRVKMARSGEGLADTDNQDILILEDVPDWLPPGRALLTTVPQTPLAHVNVLARNRGIPNAYKGGIIDDPSLDQLARVHAPAIVRASIDDEQNGQLDVVPIREAEYVGWLQRMTPTIATVPFVDTSTLPYVLDLETLSLADVDAHRPIIGGKAAGFLALHAPGVIVTPDRPASITIRAYEEHMRSFRPQLEAMLAHPEFRSSARTRYIVLEGPNKFDKRYPTQADRVFKETFAGMRLPGHVLGDLVRAGGLVKAIREKPVAADTLAEIRSALETQFAHYGPQQGLRFRSSSTVEDIEGFNGAGLYDSNTGFFDPASQPEEKDHKKSVEWALKKTWASYWHSEAFEERQNEVVEHLTGQMAVLVHARFDDPLELSNGVFTFTRMPPGFADAAVMEVNVQEGAESVTNPVPGAGALPEVDRVVRPSGGGALRIERVRPSNRVNAGEVLLSDAELQSLFEQAQAVTDAWLDEENANRDEARARRTLTLDFEMRKMADGWPAVTEGMPFAGRIVIKQARSLEPGLRSIAPIFHPLPFPRDVLGRSQRIERWVCTTAAFRVGSVDAFTDPLKAPDLGFSTAPFFGGMSITAQVDLPELGLVQNDFISLEHPQFTSVDRTGSEWTIDGRLGMQFELTEVLLSADGRYRLSNSMGTIEGTDLDCTSELLHSTPEDYLRSLLAQKASE